MRKTKSIKLITVALMIISLTGCSNVDKNVNINREHRDTFVALTSNNSINNEGNVDDTNESNEFNYLVDIKLPYSEEELKEITITNVEHESTEYTEEELKEIEDRYNSNPENYNQNTDEKLVAQEIEINGVKYTIYVGE